jgi:transcriptional regulator with XRE-family HTH domain/quercetin dioxygenase-like cupin family protein
MTHASAATDSATGDLAGDIGRRLAAYRAQRGLRVAELAREIGVTPSLISQIERGQSRPSVSTLFALAQALQVPVDAFFREPAEAAPAAAEDRAQPPPSPGHRPAEARYVVRRGSRAAIDIEGGVRWERLTPDTMAHLDFFELVYGPGAESNPTLYSHPGTEMVLMLTGRLDISVGFETYRLEPGDSMEFPSSLPHRYANPDAGQARAVTVIMYDCPADGSAPPATPVHH